MIRVAHGARAAQVQAVVQLASSGWLCLYAGARPSDPDARTEIDREVGKLVVSINEIAIQANGDALIGPLKGLAERAGRLTWWRLRSPQGIPLLDGDISGPGGEADMILTRIDLLPGDVILIDSFLLEASAL